MSLILPRQFKRKAIVASFPRSGTHFLMNTLERNFGYQAVPFVDFGGIEEQYYGTNVAHYCEVISINHDAPVIIKTHCEVDFFTQLATNQITNEKETVLSIIKRWYDIFYIYRDMEPTMESYAKHMRANVEQKNPRSNPYPKDGKELSKMEPWGSPMFHQMKQYPTFEDKWKGHVEGWKQAEKDYGVIVVKYEDLNERFDETVRELSKKLKIPVLVPERPPKDKNVVIGASFVGA